MITCPKCHRPLLDCQACKGKGGTTGVLPAQCGKCRGTGVVCPTHGGHWQK